MDLQVALEWHKKMWLWISEQQRRYNKESISEIQKESLYVSDVYRIKREFLKLFCKTAEWKKVNLPSYDEIVSSSACFCCYWVKKSNISCRSCPVEWGTDKCINRSTLYYEWDEATRKGYLYLASDLAEKIANLPIKDIYK